MGYVQSSNNCSSGVGANNGTCTIVYNVPATAATQAVQSNISVPDYRFNFAYTSQQSQTLSGSSTTNLGININVVNPTLSISPISTIFRTESATVTLNWSNLYQAIVPITNVLATESTGISAIVGLQPNPATAASCGAKSGSGATCTSNIITSESTPAASNYRFSAFSTSFTQQVTATPAYFQVAVRYPLIFTTMATPNGNLGGTSGADTICNSNKPVAYQNFTFKAMLGSSSRTASPPPRKDWVLKMNQTYMNIDNQIIGTTTAGAIFSFPLTNSITRNTTSYQWTGLTADWKNATANCFNWEQAQSSLIGASGNANSGISSSVINSVNLPCNAATNGLYCVQQN